MHIIQTFKMRKCDNLENHKSEAYFEEESEDCQTDISENLETYNLSNMMHVKQNLNINKKYC